MDCCQFREKYSDFADGLLSEADEQSARAHLARCASCRRLDAAFRTGVGAVRDLPPISISHAFRGRLRSRVRREVASRFPAMYGLSGAIGSLLVVATVGFIAFDIGEAHHARDVSRRAEVTADALPSSTQPAAAPAHADTLDPSPDAFHPLQPLLIAADTQPATQALQARLDIPAVWGGQ